MTIVRKILIVTVVVLLGYCSVFGMAVSELNSVIGQAGNGPTQDALVTLRTMLIFAGFIGAGVICVAGILMRNYIVEPLYAMEAAIARAADDFVFIDQMQNDSGDEISRVMRTYRRLLARLRDNFSAMQQATEQMSDVTESVDGSSRKIARNSQLQSDASSSIAAAVEEMTVSISLVAQQAEDASEHTRNSHNIAEHSAGVILSTTTNIQKISASVAEVAVRIKALHGDCNSIYSVAKIIREIADQTNLLALNAAIEAARAGEQGRGFAVVADEVRKLAERTTSSTQEISTLLDRMQESAKLAANSMKITEEVVSEGVISAREAGESISHIKDASNAAAQSVEEISNAIREQQVVSASISQHIEQIAQMTEQNSGNAAGAAKAIGRMSQMSRGLVQTLSAFRVDERERKVELRAADIHGDDHPAVRAQRRMSELLAQRTGGRITLKVITGGVMGSEKEALEQIKAGSLDMMRINISQLNKECPATIIPTLPFLFRNAEHMHKAMDGAPGAEILESCVPAGYLGLAFYDSGARSIYANKPIHSIADVRGLKLRVMQSDLMIAVANAMGAKATPMAMDEIIAGYGVGLVEAAENNIPTFESYKHYETFRCFSHTEHSMAPEMIIFSGKTWASLSPEDQQIIKDVARDSVAVMRTLWAEREGAARKKLLEFGVKIITGVDKQAFQQAMKPVYDKFVTSDQQKKLLRAIQEIH